MERRWVVSTAYEAAIAQVRLARKAAGITQRELARRLGKPPSFVNKIELKERRLDVVEMVAIARALGMTDQELFARISAALSGDLEI